MVYGKVPPQAKEFEMAVLGALMMEPAAYDRLNGMLRPECFYVEAHQRIFEAMQRLASKGQPRDRLMVAEELRTADSLEAVGGDYYLITLSDKVVNSAAVVPHAQVILEKFMKREAIRIGSNMVMEAYEDGSDVFELLAAASADVDDITKNNLKRPFKSIDTVLVENIKEIERMRQSQESVTGVPTGYPDLDMITCGWQPTDLIIVAARPSVGKTAFALNIARNAALSPFKPTPVAVFSLEMQDTQLTNRILAAETGIWLWKIRNGRMEEADMKQLFTRGIQKLAGAPIWIDDTGGLDFDELRGKARILVQKHGVRLIIIDYLQLITIKGIHNREQQISAISRGLKALAKELNISIIALSQMSRLFEQGATREPRLSDLRESGAIEQDADAVMFLWRPSDAEVMENAALLGVCYAKIEKNRNGSLAKFIGDFQKEIQKWKHLRVVDDTTMQPIGSNWTPIERPPAIDYSEASRHSNNDDNPF